ncbi:MAG TPA: tetratricopeptide repeat protein [Nitrospira sp.]|nr:tetratricopeptide repeat protein [Nitrospira sp.]
MQSNPPAHRELKPPLLAWLIIVGVCPALATVSGSAEAQTVSPPPEQRVIEQAKAAWETGASGRALEILEEWGQHAGPAAAVGKLRGDILTTSRRPQEAVQTYDAILSRESGALDVRWAKWSVLLRSGQEREAVDELQRIAQLDRDNPLISLRLAQDLRKLDRLEESLDWYKAAVERAPALLGWRLALARARFDVLDYEGADRDVDYVLTHLPAGSPLELPAKNLSAVIHGSTQDRGRRREIVLTPQDVDPGQLKEWALMRADAWRAFEAGRYDEAEPMYRKLLELNPRDPSATHQLGLTLMQQGRCKEAVDVFRAVSDLDPNDEQYTDTVFRMGQCLVQLEQWEDAFVHFQTLYNAAVEAENASKGAPLPPDVKVLDKQKIGRWLEKVRPHVPELAAAAEEEAAKASAERASTVQPSEDELYAQALERMNPQKPLDARASLAGRDADIAWFRFVIPAGKVMRDDFPTGVHEFIPLNPSDSFPRIQQEIYLVFGLVGASYDAVPLTAECFVESAVANQPVVAQDHVVMAMSDQSGYFTLMPPASGWKPGLYRCGLYAGERTSADTHVDEVRFRIFEPAQQPGRS